MLGISFRSLWCAGVLGSLVFLANLHAGAPFTHRLQERDASLARLVNSVNREAAKEEVDVGLLVDLLFEMRAEVLAFDVDCPSISEMASTLYQNLKDTECELGLDEYDLLMIEILQREGASSQEIGRLKERIYFRQFAENGHHKKKKGSKGVFGFIKALAGGLMCIVPIPAVQVMGGTICAVGIMEMMDDAREKGDENEAMAERDAQRRREEQRLGAG